MASCGMYGFSGEWMLRVGLPAKSGVSGGVTAGGELGFAGAERVLSMLREIAATAPNAALITVDAAERARSHPAAVMVLRTEIQNLAPRFRLLELPALRPAAAG